MSVIRTTPKTSLATPVAREALDVPGLTPRDLFFYQLGTTIYLAVQPNNDRKHFIMAAPDEETRLLGEVALELQIENLGPGDAARRIAENVIIRVGGKSVVRNRNNQPRRRGYIN